MEGTDHATSENGCRLDSQRSARRDICVTRSAGFGRERNNFIHDAKIAAGCIWRAKGKATASSWIDALTKHAKWRIEAEYAVQSRNTQTVLRAVDRLQSQFSFDRPTGTDSVAGASELATGRQKRELDYSLLPVPSEEFFAPPPAKRQKA